MGGKEKERVQDKEEEEKNKEDVSGRMKKRDKGQGIKTEGKGEEKT